MSVCATPGCGLPKGLGEFCGLCWRKVHRNARENLIAVRRAAAAAGWTGPDRQTYENLVRGIARRCARRVKR